MSAANTADAASTAGFIRLAEAGRAPVSISVDGTPVQALAGDTLLTALRAAGLALRRNEFDGAACGGFCLMGACQECWLSVAGAGRVRACQTQVAAGMQVVTGV